MNIGTNYYGRGYTHPDSWNHENAIQAHQNKVLLNFNSIVQEASLTYLTENGHTVEDVHRLFSEVHRQISVHDESSFQKDEFVPTMYFMYKENADTDIYTEDDYKKACKLHYSRNNHHWEYYVDDDGKASEMPLACILEMLSDWLAKLEEGDELYKNYWSGKGYTLHSKTKKIVQGIIRKVVI